MNDAKITREEFVAKYNDGASSPGRVVLPCECGSDLCEGWQSLPLGYLTDERDQGMENLDVLRGFYTQAELDAAIDLAEQTRPQPGQTDWGQTPTNKELA